jgi:hypothetical protein
MSRRNVSHSEVSLYATFLLTLFDPVQRSRIDVTTFLASSGSERSVNQDTEFAIVRSSGSFPDCPTQLCYQGVSGIDSAHTVVPREEVFKH